MVPRTTQTKSTSHIPSLSAIEGNSKKNSRGRPPKSDEEKQKEIKLYEDYLASGLTKTEFLQQRGRATEDDFAELERGRKAYEARKNRLETIRSNPLSMLILFFQRIFCYVHSPTSLDLICL
jgi:hypothetical protein